MDNRHINLIKHAQMHMKAYLREHADKEMPLVVCSFHDANDYLVGCLSAIPFNEIRLYSANLEIKDLSEKNSVALANISFTSGEQLAKHAVILVLRQAEHACMRTFVYKCLDNNIPLENISILSPCLEKNEYMEVCNDFAREFTLLDNALFESKSATAWRINNIPPGPYEIVPCVLTALHE